MASASAASACSGPFRPSSIPIMCCTWVLSPRPLPTTDCLTSVAAYSCTTIPRLTTAQIAAPRACPSLSAESGLRAMNTRSMPHSIGWCAAMMSQSSSKMRFRRSGKLASPATTRAPWNTWVSLPVSSTSMMPTPVRWLPGSMPMILAERESVDESCPVPFPIPDSPFSALLLTIGWQQGVVRHLAHVVQRVELVEQIMQGFECLRRHLDPVVGAHHHACVHGAQAGVDQRLLHRLEMFRCAQHGALAMLADHVVRASFQCRLQHLFLGRRVASGGEHQLAAAGELERHRTRCAQVAAMLGQRVTHIGHGAGRVVGEAFDDQRDAGRAVALIAQLLHVRAAVRPRAALDRALDG